eukprot:c25272_g2_i2 orf=241-2298(-)
MDAAAASGGLSLGLMNLLCIELAVPVWQCGLLLLAFTCLALYHALDFHIVRDLLTGFRGDSVQLFYSSTSTVASRILPKCEVLKQRYTATPWLCSPHLQTAFLHFFGRPPHVEYCRQLVCTPDGGTIALDWMPPDDCSGGAIDSLKQAIVALDETPVVVIIPGLTSDSADAYVKHLAHNVGKMGWRVVVANHRGLGRVSMTSDQFYNAGWTEDLRNIANYLHHEYPKAPLLAVGTSIGANLLVKYLGEEGGNTPFDAAAAICCPWDLVVCDRFIRQGPIRRFYNRMLALGLRCYAAMHQSTFAHVADWDLISQSCSVREFDNYFTRLVGKFETVDTYYRNCSSAQYLNSVSIPLLCISALDDPVCTKEAIPWDECRVNSNVVLGITNHGGHLAFYEGLTASGIWWVRAATEFLAILSSSSLMNRPKTVPDAGQLLSSKVLNTGASELSRIASNRSSCEKDEDDQLTSSVSNSKLELKNEKVASAMESRDTGASHSIISDIEEEHSHQTKLIIRNQLELLDLKFTLSQLLVQVQSFEYSLNNRMQSPISLSLQEWTDSAMELPDSSALVSSLSNCTQALSNLAMERDGNRKVASGSSIQDTIPRPSIDFVHNDSESLKVGLLVLKSIKGIVAQNRHALWLLAYVAIITTWPLLRSALFLNIYRRLRVLRKKWLNEVLLTNMFNYRR